MIYFFLTICFHITSCHQRTTLPTVITSDLIITPVNFLHKRSWNIQWKPFDLNCNNNNNTDVFTVTHVITYCQSRKIEGRICRKTIPFTSNSYMLTDLARDLTTTISLYAYLSSVKHGTCNQTKREFEFASHYYVICQSAIYKCNGLRCKQSDLSKPMSCYVHLQPPLIPSFLVIQSTNNSIAVQWAKIEDPNVDIDHYILKCSSPLQTTVLQKEFDSQQLFKVNTYNITNLIPNQSYNLSLHAINSYGVGQTHLIQRNTTKGDIQWFTPIIPLSNGFQFIPYQESDRIVLSYEFSSLTNTSNYMGILNLQSSNETRMISTMIKATSFLFTNLSPDTCYTVLYYVISTQTDHLLWKQNMGTVCTNERDRCREFSCVTSIQCLNNSVLCDGVKDCLDGSDEILAPGKCALPPLISSLQLFKAGFTFIRIRWIPINGERLHLQSYDIKLKNHKNIQSYVFHASSNQTEFVYFQIDNLLSMTEYVINIRGRNHFGVGPWSEDLKVITTTEVGIPGMISHDVRLLHLRHQNKILWRLSWLPPLHLANNDVDQLSYVVSYCKVHNLMDRLKCDRKNTSQNEIYLELTRNTFYFFTLVACNKRFECHTESRNVTLLTKISQKYQISCLNEYFSTYEPSKKLIGRYAILNPNEPVYKDREYLRFTCPSDFYINDPYKGKVGRKHISCLRSGQWSEPWPMCRGANENVTCLNEYESTHITGNHWQNPTANQIIPHYSPYKLTYNYDDSVQFQCPNGFSLKGTNIRSLRYKCKMNKNKHEGKWKGMVTGWPMCKGRTCDRLKVKAGYVSGEGEKRSIGFRVNITCLLGYYLWGSNTSICMDTLRWSGSTARECYDKIHYKKECVKDGGMMLIDRKTKDPYCYYTPTKQESSNYTIKIAIGISIPAFLLFLFTMIAAIFYVRYKRNQYARERAATIMYHQRGETLNLILPSYEQSEKDQPTTPPPCYEKRLLDTGQSTAFLQPDDDDDVTVTPRDQLPSYSEDEMEFGSTLVL